MSKTTLLGSPHFTLLPEKVKQKAFAATLSCGFNLSGHVFGLSLSGHVFGVFFSRLASVGKLPCVQTLLNEGADLHLRSSNGYTPLHLAAVRGHVEVVDLLLLSGAPPSHNQATYHFCSAASRNLPCCSSLAVRVHGP